MTISRKPFIGTLIAVVGLIGWWAVSEGPLRDPREAMSDFYMHIDRAEGQLADPLILNGRRVVPFVIKDISNKQMPLRRYAIGFLGNGGYSEALPVLTSILADEEEVSHFRADALIAIYMISPREAQELAPHHLNNEGFLGHVAKRIVSGIANDDVAFKKRGWLNAFFGVHD